MKIIDILNDYAKGKIKEGFKFRCCNQNWIIEDDNIHSINQYMSHDDMGDYEYFEDCFDLSNLNDEVEIIEERPKNIEAINYLEHVGIDLSETVCKKINELTKAVNYLLEKEK